MTIPRRSPCLDASARLSSNRACARGQIALQHVDTAQHDERHGLAPRVVDRTESRKTGFELADGPDVVLTAYRQEQGEAQGDPCEGLAESVARLR